MTPEPTLPDLDRMFMLMDEIEYNRKPAIEHLLKQRDDIEAKLKRLGYSGNGHTVEVGPIAEWPAVVDLPAVTVELPGVAAANGTAVKPYRPLLRHCKVCGKTGHDIRRCPKAK